MHITRTYHQGCSNRKHGATFCAGLRTSVKWRSEYVSLSEAAAVIIVCLVYLSTLRLPVDECDSLSWIYLKHCDWIQVKGQGKLCGRHRSRAGHLTGHTCLPVPVNEVPKLVFTYSSSRRYLSMDHLLVIG